MNRGDALLERYRTCTAEEDLEELLDVPGAMDPELYEAVYQDRMRVRFSEASAQDKEQSDWRCQRFFALVGRRLVEKSIEADNAAPPAVAPRQRRSAAEVIEAQRQAAEEALAGKSRHDVRRAVARLMANMLCTTATELADIVELTRETADATTPESLAWLAGVLKRFAPASELLSQFAELVLSPRWPLLDARPESLGILRFYVCHACGGAHCQDFWIFVGETDQRRREALADGTLNRAPCVHCGSEAGRMAYSVAIGPQFESEITRRSVVCATHFGFIVRAPALFDGREDLLRVVEVLATPLFALREGVLQNRGAAYVLFSDEDVRWALDLSRYADSPENDTFNRLYVALLLPFVRAVRAGELTYEEAEARVAKAVAAEPTLSPSGTMGSRELESSDPDVALLIALIAKTNEASGWVEAAAMGYLEAAAQAQLAGRGAAVLSFADRAERLLDDPAISEPMRLGARGQLHLIRAGQLANIGAGGVIEELRRAVEANRKLVDTVDANVRIAPSVLNLASSLQVLGQLLSHSDFRAAEAALQESIELSARADEEGESPPDALRRELRSVGTLAAHHMAGLYGDCKQFIHAVAWWRDAPATPQQRRIGRQFLDRRGIDAALLRSNIEFMAERFPEFWRIDPVTGGGGFRAGLFDAIELRRRELLQRAYDVAAHHGAHRIASAHAAELGDTFRADGNEPEALRFGEVAVEHARTAGEPQMLARALVTRAALRTGGDAAALADLREAYMSMMDVRRYLALDQQRVTFGAATAPVARMIADALRDAPGEEWTSVLETIKAGALADAFERPPIRLSEMAGDDDFERLRELEAEIARRRAQLLSFDAVTPTDPAELLSAIRSLERRHDELQRSLMARHPRYSESFADVSSSFPEPAPLLNALRQRYGAASAFVGLWVHEEDVLVYGWAPDGSALRMRIPLLASLRREAATECASVAELAEEYRAALFDLGRDPGGEARFRERFGEPLHRVLWRDVAAALGAAAHVVISPHGALHTIPWATLWDGEQYLAARHTFTTVFSLTAAARAVGAETVRPRRITVLADPDLGNARHALPGARIEAQMIEATAREAGVEIAVFVGDAATRAALEAESSRSDAVHLACHGEFRGGAAARSSLLLSGGGTAERLTMQQIAEELDLRGTALVTLSACETGRAEIAPGGDALGLTRSFSLAGARELVASLWRVGDQAAALLMATFYSHLFGDDDHRSAIALAAAQRDMLGGPPFASNPFAWGAFVHYSV